MSIEPLIHRRLLAINMPDRQVTDQKGYYASEQRWENALFWKQRGMQGELIFYFFIRS